jgi:hypothetical protein
MMALKNEAATQTAMEGGDSHGAIDLSCPPEVDVSGCGGTWSTRRW